MNELVYARFKLEFGKFKLVLATSKLVFAKCKVELVISQGEFAPDEFVLARFKLEPGKGTDEYHETISVNSRSVSLI